MKRFMNAAFFRRSLVVGAVVSAGALAASCSPAGKDSKVANHGAGATTGSGGGGGVIPGGGGSTAQPSGPNLGDVGSQPDEPCMGLECQVPVCAPGTTTSISGKVFAPNGTLPLYNVLVYVPNPTVSPVMPFTDGASCDRCGASVVNPVTSAITDETGTFKLENAPAGANIPLVIQVGKWRRQVTIPAVNGCVDTPLTDPEMTRLPKNKTEGDIPLIAIAAGGADQMECLPLRLGIDPAEFTPAAGTGRIRLYSGEDQGGNHPITSVDTALPGGGPLTPATELWADKDSLMKYDIVILSCEGNSYPRSKPMTSRQAMYDYASSGGRVFASHFHNIWFEDGPDPLPMTGNWNQRRDPPNASMAHPATINQAFPKGEALAKWLVNVGASTTLGLLDLVYPRDNIQSVNAAVARDWITLDNTNYPEAPTSVQYLSFNTPIGVSEELECGREVYTNVHVAATDSNDPTRSPIFPVGCQMKELTAQEKAVAFMLFDLSACVMNDDKEPEPPH